MVECTGLYFSENQTIKKISCFNADRFKTGIILYEVLRIYKGTSLFLDDHLERLLESVRLSGYSFSITFLEIYSLLRNLINKNNISTGNVKIILHFISGAPDPVMYSFFVPHSYPTPVMYHKGVSTALYSITRPDPHVKKMMPDMLRLISEYIRTEELYDALLVAEDETITEGSRTNVFFIRDELVYTPPGEMVLKGITRKKVIELCNKLNIKLIEQPIYTNSLDNYHAAFLTGTSPKVLPIRKIGNLSYAISTPVMTALMKAYDNLIASDIRQYSHEDPGKG